MKSLLVIYKDEGSSIEVRYDIPETTEEAISEWGDDYVYDILMGKVLSNLRTNLKKFGTDREAAQRFASTYKPGRRTPSINTLAKELATKLSEAEIKDLLERVA